MMVALLFLSSFAYYLCTMSGTIPSYRDSGDLITAIHTLGIAHPPAYPLYVMAGRIFSVLMPFANAAYRVNAFSALCMAASVALVYKVAAKFGNLGAGVAAVFFALTPAVVSLARVAEMYAAAAALGGLVVLSAAVDTPQSLLAGCFLLGLGFGVHPTLLFLGPLFFPLAEIRQQRFGEAAAKIFGRLSCFAIGFSILVFLPVRAATHPLANWGDPSTWGRFWNVLTRGNYGGLKLHPTESRFVWTGKGVLVQITYFFQTLQQQWKWLGLALGILGAGVTGRRRKGLFVAWLLLGPGFFLLSNLPIKKNTTAPILEPYLVLENWIWALWMAAGIAWVASRMPSRALRWIGGIALLCAACVMRPTLTRSQRGDYYAYDLGRNMLATLPPEAVVYDPDDQISFSLRTLQVTQARRGDVVLLNFFRTLWGYTQIRRRWPDLLPPGPLNNALELEQALWHYSILRRPFYTDLPVKVQPPLTYEVEGILYRIETAADPKQAVQSLQRSENLFPLYRWQGVWRTTELPDFFTQQILNYAASAQCNLGLEYANRGDDRAAEAHYGSALCIDPHLAAVYNNRGTLDFMAKRFSSAVENYRLALRYDPENAGFWRNLGLALQAVGYKEEAVKAFQRADALQNPT